MTVQMALSLVLISIHAPAKGATSIRPFLLFRQFISIHAPAKGATCGLYDIFVKCNISIHAPAKGATITGGMRDGECNDFNPRSRKGSDPCVTVLSLSSIISIHAPAKGATSNVDYGKLAEGISIHAPAKGATKETKAYRDHKVFQSTLPQRERR